MLKIVHRNTITTALNEFDLDMTTDFSKNWDRLRKGSVNDDMWLEESEERTVGNIAAKSELHMKRCNHCPVSIFLLLHEYKILPNAYPSLSSTEHGI